MKEMNETFNERYMFKTTFAAKIFLPDSSYEFIHIDSSLDTEPQLLICSKLWCQLIRVQFILQDHLDIAPLTLQGLYASADLNHHIFCLDFRKFLKCKVREAQTNCLA